MSHGEWELVPPHCGATGGGTGGWRHHAVLAGGIAPFAQTGSLARIGTSTAQPGQVLDLQLSGRASKKQSRQQARDRAPESGERGSYVHSRLCYRARLWCAVGTSAMRVRPRACGSLSECPRRGGLARACGSAILLRGLLPGPSGQQPHSLRVRSATGGDRAGFCPHIQIWRRVAVTAFWRAHRRVSQSARRRGNRDTCPG